MAKLWIVGWNITTGETSQVITSRHFSSLLFTSMSILTSLALINWKANTIHIHISKNSTFSIISLHFLLPLLLSIERQKQYKYINKAIQKVQSSTYILDTLKPRLYKKFPYFRHTSWQIWDTLKARLYKKFNIIISIRW